MKYLKGLDTLRATAAIFVVIDHIEIIKQRSHIYNMIDHPSLIYPDGHLSVMLFFVISGFLITYLLLKEKEKDGAINIKKFYLRRTLRIWPLYYLLLLLSYVIFQPNYSLETISLSLLILPNIGYALKQIWEVSPQIWSIGAEEQFYIFWPFIFIFITKKNTLKYLIFIIFGCTILPYLLKSINLVFFQSEEFYGIITRFFYGTKFNSLCLGALAGFIFYINANDEKPNPKLNVFRYTLTLLPFVLWLFKFEISHLNDELYSVMFTFSLYNIVQDPKIKIDNIITKFLGKISYGIYLYHWIIILLIIKILPKDLSVSYYNLILYISALACTVLISWFSHITYERFFLKMKKKYEVSN